MSEQDIVERLYKYVVTGHNPDGPPPLTFHPPICVEAADEITRLRARVKELEGALDDVGNAASFGDALDIACNALHALNAPANAGRAP